MPRYGEGAPVGNPFLGGAVTASEPAERPASSGVFISAALAISLNVVSLLGVVAFGWPPGNVFALFWLENVILGLWSLIKVLSAKGQAKPGAGVRVNGGPSSNSPVLLGVFFTFHYGLFCLVHGVFTAIVAYKIGYELSFWLLGFPVILIMIRYTGETLTTWFGRGALRWRTSPTQAMMAPYPRIIVLQFATIIAFGLSSGGMAKNPKYQAAREFLEPIINALPTAWQSQGVALVLILLVIKTIVDVATTIRATRSQ